MGATYYVKTAGNGGSDAAAGTAIGTAWATLQKAANTAVAGDTVKVDSGTYAGFRAINSGTVNNRITFEPYVGTGSYTDSGILVTTYSTASGQLGPIWLLGQDYITVKGFTCNTSSQGTDKGNFQASSATGIWLLNCRSTGGNNHWGIKGTDSHAIVVQGCLCEDSAGEHGIYIAGADNPIIRGNTCSGNAWNGIHVNVNADTGAPFHNAGALIEDNVCFDNTLAGCDFTGMNTATVRNNICYGNGRHAMVFQNQPSGVGMPACHDNLVVNNTLDATAGSSAFAIEFADDATGATSTSNDVNTTVFNNILLGNTASGNGSIGSLAAVASTFKSDYNIVVDAFRTGATARTLAAWRTNTSQDAHSALSPGGSSLFTNYASKDFTLKTGSAAIAFGQLTFNSQSAPTDDILGILRGLVPDAGAYEFAADAGGGAAANTYTGGRYRPGVPRGAVYQMGRGMGRR